MTIGEVAARVGLATSAIRYYEKMGLLRPAARTNGRRVYASEVMHQLVVIRFAKDNGFTLPEIKRLLQGFPESTAASTRWKKLARNKIRELEATIARAKTMKSILERLSSRCQCLKFEQCARGFSKRMGLRSVYAEAAARG